MELRQIRYFIAVAEEMHFGRAAERLHIVQPALSRQIAALERELGFKLLERTKRKVAFTPAGELLFSEAKGSLQRLDKAIASAGLTARGELGQLEIGYIGPAMWSVLRLILQEHRVRKPEMKVDLIELDGDIQIQRLRDGLLDIGFLRPVAHEELLVFETIWHEQTLIALPENHPLAAVDEVDLVDLRDETFVVMNRRRARVQHDALHALFRQHGFSPNVVEGNTPSSLNLVALGQAVAAVPESLQGLPIAGVVFRPVRGPSPVWDLAVAYRRDDPSAALQAFLEIVRRTAAQLSLGAPTVS
jgi:DNA-binding transcriptional LysR family regulator